MPWAHHSIKSKACTWRLPSSCCIPMTICCPAKNSFPLHFSTNVTRSSKVSSICTWRMQHFALQVMSDPASRITTFWNTWQYQRAVVCFCSLCQQGSKDMITNSLLGTSVTSFATTWHINDIFRHSMLDPCNLGHSLPTLSCHNLENTLFESLKTRWHPPIPPNMSFCTCSTPSYSLLHPNRRMRSCFATRSCWKVQRSNWSTGL